MEQSTLDRNLDLQPGSRGRGGRKNKDGIEETVKVPTLKEACPRLMRQLRHATEAMKEYRESLAAVCEKTNANAATVNKLLKASLKGNFEDARRSVEQQQLVFEGVGEVSDAHAK